MAALPPLGFGVFLPRHGGGGKKTVLDPGKMRQNGFEKILTVAQSLARQVRYAAGHHRPPFLIPCRHSQWLSLPAP